MKSDEDALRTSWTLVARLKNVDDQESWRGFYGLYRGFIVGAAIKAGLREDEAEEVLQDTMAAFANHIQDFSTDPARGSLRAWLLTTARRRIQDRFRKRPPAGADPGTSPPGTATTATVERVPDPREVDLEGLCDAQWEEQIKVQALNELQLAVKAEHYQVFHLLVLEQKPVREVARMVGRNAAQVYLIKHRVTQALKRIAKRLQKRFEWPVNVDILTGK